MNEYQLSELTESCRQALIDKIKRGAVGILPTETVYGLLCLAGNEAGRERIYKMKSREPRKPMQYLLSDLTQAEQINVPVTPAVRRIADRFWPGPLTVVMPDSEAELQGLRLPDHTFTRQFIKDLASPVHATSANLSGTDPFESAKKGFSDLSEKPDFIVWDDMINRCASTVVKLNDDESLNEKNSSPSLSN